MKIKKYISIILFYGVIWGMFEFVLGGYLHFIKHPFNDTIMMLIGYTILCICVLKNKSSLNLLGIGIIAAFFKLFNTFTCGISLMSPGIINPIFSILKQTIIVTIISFVIFRIKQHNMVQKKNPEIMLNNL